MSNYIMSKYDIHFVGETTRLTAIISTWVLNVLWSNFYGYKSVDHGKMWSISTSAKIRSFRLRTRSKILLTTKITLLFDISTRMGVKTLYSF